MVDSAAGPAPLAVRLYTAHYLVRGTLAATRERLVDLLNGASDFLVLDSAFFDEFGSREVIGQASFVQVNLDMVILAVPEESSEPAGETSDTTAGVSTRRDQVLLAVAPYRVTGRLELPTGQDLRRAFAGSGGRFVEVTDATYWSEPLNEPRTRAPLVAVNHLRSHVVSPFEERDVWAGVDDGTIRRSEAEDVPPEEAAEATENGLWVMDSDVGSLAQRES